MFTIWQVDDSVYSHFLFNNRAFYASLPRLRISGDWELDECDELAI